MKVLQSFKTTVTNYQSTRRNVGEDLNLQHANVFILQLTQNDALTTISTNERFA
jgi:hypothetical protein